MEIQTALTWQFSSLLTGSAQIPKVLKFFLGTPRCFYYNTKKKCGHDYSWFHFTEYASILKSFDPPFVTKSLIPWTKDTFQYIHAQLLQSCPALCDPRSRSPWVSSVPGVVQARTLEWVAVPSSRGSSPDTKKYLLNTTLYDLRISMPHTGDWSQTTLPRTGKSTSYFAPPPVWTT